MSMKKIKVMKTIRLFLFTIYLYFMFNISDFNSSHRVSFILVSTSIALCGFGLVFTLPKEKQSGNTFLDTKYRWIEVGVEILVIISLTWILCQF